MTDERVEILDDGRFRVKSSCPSCRVEQNLDSDEEPGVAAINLAALVLCEPCAEREAEREERAAKIAKFTERVRAAAIPADLAGLDFDDMDREGGRRTAISAARAWAEGHGPAGLLLVGDPGVGKTRLAATALGESLRLRSGVWISVPVLLVQVATSFSDDGRRAALAAVSGTGTLVLDDLGKENPTDFARQTLLAALDRRLQAGARVLVTSNLTAEDLGERLGSAFASRLGSFKLAVLPGGDRRLT